MPNNAIQWVWFLFFCFGSLGGCVFLYAVIREGLKRNPPPMPRINLPMAPRGNLVMKKEEPKETEA